MTTAKLQTILGLVLAGTAACRSGDGNVGVERGRCYPNLTCNEGLVCLSEICVKPVAEPAATPPAPKKATPASEAPSPRPKSNQPCRNVLDCALKCGLVNTECAEECLQKAAPPALVLYVELIGCAEETGCLAGLQRNDRGPCLKDCREYMSACTDDDGDAVDGRTVGKGCWAMVKCLSGGRGGANKQSVMRCIEPLSGRDRILGLAMDRCIKSSGCLKKDLPEDASYRCVKKSCLVQMAACEVKDNDG